MRRSPARGATVAALARPRPTRAVPARARVATALLLSLTACGPGTLTTPDGPEPLRAALYFAPDTSLSVAALGTRQSYVVLANSTMPCEPEAVEDDPATSADEVLSAEAYWIAQLQTAFAREGARVVVLVLAVGPEEDWLGRYDVEAAAWEPVDMGAAVAMHGRVAAGGWYHVEESAVDGASGVLYADSVQIVEEEHDLAVDSPAWVEVDARDQVLAGSFDFPSGDLSGRFTADRCDNSELLSEIYQGLLALGRGAGALTE